MRALAQHSPRWTRSALVTDMCVCASTEPRGQNSLETTRRTQKRLTDDASLDFFGVAARRFDALPSLLGHVTVLAQTSFDGGVVAVLVVAAVVDVVAVDVAVDVAAAPFNVSCRNR